MDEKKVILKIQNLSKDFKIKSRKLSEKPQILHALSNVSLDVYEGEDNNVYTDKSDVAITNDITARLQMFPQLVLTSHQAFFTREALQAIAVVTMENARNFNEGNELGNAECKA